MASLNQVTIIGNLGGDPELRYTQSQKAVSNLSVAVNRSWPNGNGGWNEETTWFRVSVWDDQAERVAERLKKGDQVFVQGRMKPPNVFQRQSGDWDASLEIDGRLVYRLGKKDDAAMDGQDGRVTTGREPVAAAAASSTEMDVDDIPF